MFGLGLLSTIGTILTLLILGPPLLGAAYAVLTTQPMPVFFPKDVLSKATYGATWGFWTVWQWIRPLTGLTGGAQVAVAKITDGTIAVPSTPDELNESSTWYGLLANVVTYAGNATSLYIQYADTFSVDVNQSWHITLFVVSNDGLVWLARFDAVWLPENLTDPLNPILARMQLNAYGPSDVILDPLVSPHYGVVVTLDTVTLAEFMLTGTQIDWAKFAANTLQTFYKGNIQAWTMAP